MTPEAEMQMAVNVFELAGAPKLIGEHFIAPYYSVVGFQLVVESILTSNSEGARFAPNITSSVKAALHSEGARTFPTILSVQPHGPCPQVDCYLRLDKNIPYLSRRLQQQQRCTVILLTFSTSSLALSASLASASASSAALLASALLALP
jgi:hypothetical protein